MLKSVLTIVDRRELALIGALIVPLAMLDVLAILAIRTLFVTMGQVNSDGSAFENSVFFPDGFSAFSAAIAIGVGLLLFLVARGIASHAIWLAIIRSLTRVQGRVLERLFAQFVSLPLQERMDNSVSEQKHILLLSAQAMFHQVLLPLSSVFAEGVIAVSITVVLLVIEPAATLVLGLWLCLVFGLYYTFLKPRAAKVGHVRWQSLHALRQIIDGALGDLRWIKITHSEGLFQRLFGTKVRSYTEAMASDRALTLLPRYIADVAVVSSVLILFIYFGISGAETAALFSGVALFAAASLRLLPAFYRLVALSYSLAANAPDLGQVIKNYQRKISLPDVLPDLPQKKPLFEKQLEMNQVRFRYPGQDADTLSQVTLTLGAGDRVLVTGESGSGKSTLLALTLGLLNADTGTIKIDGNSKPILDAVRCASVALVSQDPFIATGTVADNIAFPHAANTINSERAEVLLRGLGLKWSLDRTVGENGTKLSGGERQRLALARALYLEPALLILDEATSQMDFATARRAYELIFARLPKSTVLICTHQDFPKSFCTSLWHVEGGRVHSESTETIRRESS